MSFSERSPEQFPRELDMRRGERENALTQSRGKQLASLTGLTYSQALQTSPETQASADPATWEKFRDYTQELKNFSEKRRSKEGMLAAVQGVLTDDRIDNLPSPDEAFLQTSGMQALVYVNGIAVTDRRGNERTTMRDIHQKIMATASGEPKFLKNNKSYVVESEDTYVVDRAELEKDLVWLEDDKRIGSNVPPERLAYFQAYKNILVDLVRLNNRPAEEAYRKRYGSVLSPQKCLESFCRDPNSIKGAGKFALFIALSALLALWSIKDFQKGFPSFATIMLLGAVMYLVGGRSKMGYVATQEFNNATKEGLDGDKMEELYAFARRKPAAFKEMIRMMKLHGPGGIPEKDKHLLTEPKKNGKLLKHLMVDEDIADMMVGKNSPPIGVLQGIYNTRMSRNKDVAVRFAEANSKSKGQTAHELNNMMRHETNAAGPYNPQVDAPPIKGTPPYAPGTPL